MTSINGPKDLVDPDSVEERTMFELMEERSNLSQPVGQQDLTSRLLNIEKDTLGTINMKRYGYVNTPISEAFVSPENRRYLNRSLTLYIYKQTGVWTVDGGSRTLLNTMIQVFCDEYRHVVHDQMTVNQAVRALNAVVLKTLGQRAVMNVNLQMDYLKSLDQGRRAKIETSNFTQPKFTERENMTLDIGSQIGFGFPENNETFNSIDLKK